MANDMRKLVIFLVIAWLVIGQGEKAPDNGNGNGDGNGGNTDIINMGCAYAPTVELQAADRWDSAVVQSTTFTYKLNGGNTVTDSDGKFEVGLGDDLEILWGKGNETIYNEVIMHNINKCGLNVILNNQLVQNTSFTVQCFNEEGNLIDDAGENETISAGDAPTLACEIVGKNKKGMPHGGVLIVELPRTYYDEADTTLTGEIIGTKRSGIPGAYTISNTAMSAFAWDIKPILSSGTKDFDISIKADASNDPTISSTTGDILLYLHSIDCYENSDTYKFECNVETEDSTWAGDQVGSETIQVD